MLHETKHLNTSNYVFVRSFGFNPEATARSAVLGVSPGRRLLIPLVYLHPGKCEHSEVQNHPSFCNGRSTLDGFRRYAHARVQAEDGLVSIKLVIG